MEKVHLYHAPQSVIYIISGLLSCFSFDIPHSLSAPFVVIEQDFDIQQRCCLLGREGQQSWCLCHTQLKPQSSLCQGKECSHLPQHHLWAGLHQPLLRQAKSNISKAAPPKRSPEWHLMHLNITSCT